MKRTEKAYIQIELGTATWNVDLESNGEQDILDEGIDCQDYEVYEILYEDGYMIDEDKLKMLLDEHDNRKNMFFPLDNLKDLSYSGWLEYKQERDEAEELKKQKRKDNK